MWRWKTRNNIFASLVFFSFFYVFEPTHERNRHLTWSNFEYDFASEVRLTLFGWRMSWFTTSTSDETVWFSVSELNHHGNCFLPPKTSIKNPRRLACVNYSNLFCSSILFLGESMTIIYAEDANKDRKYISLKVVHRFSFHSVVAAISEWPSHRLWAYRCIKQVINWKPISTIC